MTLGQCSTGMGRAGMGVRATPGQAASPVCQAIVNCPIGFTDNRWNSR